MTNCPASERGSWAEHFPRMCTAGTYIFFTLWPTRSLFGVSCYGWLWGHSCYWWLVVGYTGLLLAYHGVYQ